MIKKLISYDRFSRSGMNFITAFFYSFVWMSLGSCFYHLHEGWSILDSIYMVVITISTVGFMEVHELSEIGRIFTTVFILIGTLVNIHALTRLAQFIFEGEILEILGVRKMQQQIKSLNKHTILCGFGSLGRHLAEELEEKGVNFIILEHNTEKQNAMVDGNWLHLIGDCTDDEILVEAGINEADTILALLPSDAGNLFLTIAARELNPDIHIIALADQASSAKRLKRSGANEVISPYIVTSHHITKLVTEH